MPRMDGYQLISAVKDLYPSVKIQIVSGFVEEDSINKEGDIFYENHLPNPIMLKCY